MQGVHGRQRARPAPPAHRDSRRSSSSRRADATVETAKSASEVDMQDGVVDMDAFSQILALDEADQTKEFSKALVWAWCDQAEHAVEEMDLFLAQGETAAMCNKAHYLKGSSASLGLIRVSQTCQSLYNVHFPPSLTRFRSYSYQSDYFGSAGSSISSASSGSSSSSASPTPPQASFDKGGIPSIPSPWASPKFSSEPTNFEAEKLTNAKRLLDQLKTEIREASEWLYTYYQEFDRYAADT